MPDVVQDRPYQREFIDGNARHPGVFGAWKEWDAAVGMLPTGCGKTICAAMVARRVLEEWKKPTLFLAHREELIRQAADKFGRMGLDCAIEMAAERVDLHAALYGQPDVVIATVQTMQGRRLARWDRAHFGALITDEAHHARAASYKRIYDHFGGTKHLGITATPDRADELNIGAVYGGVAFEYSLSQAIHDGWLCPIVVARMPCNVDLKNIKTTGGDYNQAELESRIAPHVESLAAIVLAETGDRPTVIFCPDVGSAEAAADCLNKLAPGRGARAVSGRDGKLDRRDTLRQFDDGRFQYLACCDLLIEGWDCPKVAAIVVMRPTKSRARYVQMIGRGTRLYGGPGVKPDCLVIDFAWETTKDHDLVTPIDLFDDSSLDDDVSEVAKMLLAEGKTRDPIRAIEDAEQIVRERPKFQIRLTGQRASYGRVVYDPCSVGPLLGVPIKRSWDFNPANPASPKQLDLLRNKGIENPEGISKSGAGKMIDAIFRRQQDGLASVKQVKYLIALGVESAQAATMTFDQASESITQLRRRSA